MICFECKSEFSELKTLVAHFKNFHSFNYKRSYICCEELCNRQCFSNLSKFKRHALAKHNNVVNETTVVFSKPQIGGHCEPELNQPTNITPSITSPPFTETQSKDSLLNVFDFKTESNKLVLKLVSKNNLTIKDAFEIKNNFNEITSKMLLFIQNMLPRDNFNSFDSYIQTQTAISDLKTVCEDGADSEYKLFNFLKEHELISPIKLVTIDNEISITHHLGESLFDDVIKTGVLLPIEFQIKKLFEKNGKLKWTLEHQNKLKDESSEYLRHFVQGKLWSEKIKTLSGKITVPYFIYFDDFEINNPLGTHATIHKQLRQYTTLFHLHTKQLKSKIFFWLVIYLVKI